VIEVLATLVSPQFGAALLARVLEFIVPAAQSLLLAIAAFRIGWLGLAQSFPATNLAASLAELGACIVKTAVLSWILANWSELSSLFFEEGPRLAALITGVQASPGQLAAKMVALVARFGDASMFGLLDSTSSPAPYPVTTSGAGFASTLAAGVIVLLGQAVAAMIAVMLALPQLLVAVCLALGPFAVAAHLADNQLTRELFEGWAETTASALLALPVMAVLVAIVSSSPIPDPLMGPEIGAGRSALDQMTALANDLAMLLVIGQLMFLVLPLASGLIQGRPPSARAFAGMVLAICLVPLKAIRGVALSHSRW
jgi:type IV secretory pathway TrbL component